MPFKKKNTNKEVEVKTEVNVTVENKEEKLVPCDPVAVNELFAAQYWSLRYSHVNHDDAWNQLVARHPRLFEKCNVTSYTSEKSKFARPDLAVNPLPAFL